MNNVECIMNNEGWKEVKLGEVGRIVTGKTPLTKIKAYYDGNIHFVSPADLNSCLKYIYYTDKTISEAGLNSIKGSILPADAICVSCIGNLGYIGKTIMPCASNQQINSVIVDESKYDVDFIYYAIKSLWRYFKSQENQSTTISILNKSTFSNITISLPPLPTQQHIAGILSSLDSKIECNQKICKNLEEEAQALFKHWFVDFVPFKDGKFIDSELGLIPEGWRVENLKDIFYFQEGPGIRNWQYVNNNGVKFINIRCISNGLLNLDTANMISKEEAYGKYKHFLIDDGDLLISTSGTLGKYAIVTKDNLPLCLNTSVIRFKPIEDFGYSYMYSFLTSKIFKELLLTFACGSVQANFGPMHLKKIRLLYPSYSTLKQYNNVVFPMLQNMTKLRRENLRLAQLRDALLPKLMSGQIKV